MAVAGCSQKPSASFTTGEILLDEDFDRAIGWDSGKRDQVQIGVEGSAYRIHTNVNSYVRGFNSTSYENVIIDVVVSQFTADDNNAYGIVCRGTASDESSNGYYFLIGSDGSYTIRIGRFGEVDALVNWARTEAVNQDGGVNQLRAVCVDNYLALYINHQFVADVRDTTYSRGYIGFTAAASQGTTLDVAFDDLVVREGVLE